MKRWVFVFALVGITLILGETLNLMASGTYPGARGGPRGRAKFPKWMFKNGEVLFTKDCLACHGKGEDQAFSRRSLKKLKQASKLLDQIDKCVTDPQRVAGQSLKDQDKYSLVSYISSKKRVNFKLSKDQVKKIKQVIKENREDQ